MKTHGETEDLISRLVVQVAGLECLRDELLRLLTAHVPAHLHETVDRTLGSSPRQRWNAEAFERVAEVSSRFGLSLDPHISELIQLGSGILPAAGPADSSP